MSLAPFTPQLSGRAGGIALLCSALLATACASDKGGKADTVKPAAVSAAPAMAPATPDSAAAAMASTGDPDHDFLRAMTDHHKGLIAMAHETIESKDKLGVQPLAKRIDSEQDEEMDKMSTMLEQDFKDPYAPKITPGNQALVDQLTGKTGAEYDHTFLQNVIAHHQETLKMIDDYLPKAKNAKLKAMAETMKATKTKEIAEFQKQLAK